MPIESLEREHEIERIADELQNSQTLVYNKYGDAELAEVATLNSRIPKKNVTEEFIKKKITETLAHHGTTLEGLLQKTSLEENRTHSQSLRLTPKGYIDLAIEKITEQQSTFSRETILTEAFKLGLGEYEFKEFESTMDQFLESGEVLRVGERSSKNTIADIFTSKQMFAIEQSIINSCKERNGTCVINVDICKTNDFIERTDLSLKIGSLATLYGQEAAAFTSKVSSKTMKDITAFIDKYKNDATENLTERKEYKQSLEKLISSHKEELQKIAPEIRAGFTQGQKDAIRQIAATKCQFSVIQGDAGTGKSFSMLYAKNLLEANGYTVRGFAPTGKAATELINSAKIAPEKCTTVDSFMLSPQAQGTVEKGKEVWVVDEAGMLGSKKFRHFMNYAQANDCKVVFVGDRKQFASIEAGRMFAELQDKSGIDMVIMGDVQRQKTDQTKDIVKAISLRDFDFAFMTLKGHQQLDFDRADISKYHLHQVIHFKEPVHDIPEDVTAEISGIGRDFVEVTYTDFEGRQISSKVSIETLPESANIFDSGSNHSENQLTKYAVGQFVSGQGRGVHEILSINSNTITCNPSEGNGGNIVFSEIDLAQGNCFLCDSAGKPVLSTEPPRYKNMVTIEQDRQKRMSQAADDYLGCFTNKKDALLITGTNKDRSELNAMIRPELVSKGLVTGSQTFNVFHAKNVSGAAALSADSYKPGTILIMTQDFCDFKRGMQCEVVSVSPETNDIKVKYFNNRKSKEEEFTFDVKTNTGKFSSFETVDKEFGRGDLIIFLKNDKKVGVSNGMSATIEKIDKGGNVTAKLRDGDKRTVKFNLHNKGDKAYNYIDHAYAISDYKSQGATTKRIIWHAPTDGPISSNSFYVAITRCKEEVAVYTDDAERLKESVKEEQHKESTLDYTEKMDRPTLAFQFPDLYPIEMIRQKVESASLNDDVPIKQSDDYYPSL